jgi:hypothetical protein
MEGIALFNNDYITVQYVPAKRFIYHTVHKPVSGAIFRSALMAGTDGLIRYKAYKWLSDDRKNGQISREDVEWGIEVWNAQTIAAGWRYWAVLVPPAIANAASLMPVIEALYELGLNTKVFTELESAIAWLDEKPDAVITG